MVQRHNHLWCLHFSSLGRLARSLACTSLTLIAATVLLISQPRSASATALNIDFGGFFGTPPSTYGGYANQSGTWNEITTAGSSNLNDLSGNALPGVTLNLSLTTTIAFATTDGFIGPNPNLSTNDQALVGDNFATGLGTWNVTISGLRNGLYSLYVYSSVNDIVPTGTYTVNGTAESSIAGGNNDNTPLLKGINYAIDSVELLNGMLSLDSGSQSGPFFTGLAGLQLVPSATPTPAALPLLATGLCMIGFLNWRRKRKNTVCAA